MTESESALLAEWVTVNNDSSKIEFLDCPGLESFETENDLTPRNELEKLAPVFLNRMADLKQIETHREDLSLVWLDALVDPEDLHTQELMNKLSNSCEVWNDIAACRNYLSTIYDSIILIISGSCAMQCLDSFHSIRSVDSIVIYCAKLEKYSWIRNAYEKVVACVQIEKDLIESIHDLMTVKCQTPFNILIGTRSKGMRDLSTVQTDFLWHLVMINIILRMPYCEESLKHMLDHCLSCYRSNDRELANIKEFKATYCPEMALQWYTKNSFVCKEINKALRTKDIDAIFCYRRLFCDIHRQLSEIHNSTQNKVPVSDVFKVFRGQQILMSDLLRFKHSLGHLVITKSFLSTSLSYDIALAFAQGPIIANYTPALFEITIESTHHQSVCYADISKLSLFSDEQEVLINLGCIFRIVNVDYNEKASVWWVSITSISTDEEPYLPKFYDLFPFNHCEDNEVNQYSLAYSYNHHYVDRISEIADVYFHRMPKSKAPNALLGSSYSSENITKYEQASSIYEKKATKLHHMLCSHHLEGCEDYHLDYVDDYKEILLLCQVTNKRFHRRSTHLTINTINTKEEFCIKDPILCFDISQSLLNEEQKFFSAVFSEFQLVFITNASQLSEQVLRSQLNKQQLYYVSSEAMPSELMLLEKKWFRAYCLNANLTRPARNEYDSDQLRETYVTTAEELKNKLYHDLGQFYSNAAEQVLHEKENSKEAKDLLTKSVRCYELLSGSIRDKIKRYRNSSI